MEYSFHEESHRVLVVDDEKVIREILSDFLSMEGYVVKTVEDGLQALEWWKEGRLPDIIDYCRKDVAITRDIYLFGRKNGYLLFNNKSGTAVRVPVGWK